MHSSEKSTSFEISLSFLSKLIFKLASKLDPISLLALFSSILMLQTFLILINSVHFLFNFSSLKFFLFVSSSSAFSFIRINKSNFELDKKKFENVIKTTSFENMQNLEKEKGFSESWVDEKTGKKIPFFYLGPKNNWKKNLDVKVVKKLEKTFKLEMEELGYL